MATLSAGGLVSGMDTDSVVAKLTAVESTALNKMKTQKTDRTTEQTNLGKLANKLRTLQEHAEKLMKSDTFLANTASSTSTDIAVTVDGQASAGTYSVKTTQLARQSRAYSTDYSARDQAGLLPTGTMTMNVGSASANVEVTADDTLDTIAQKINAAGVGAKASVFYDGSTYRLSVSGTQTGAANGVVFGGNDLGLVAGTVPALDAKVEIDGFEVTSPTNTISSALTGVTIEAKKLQSTPETITISSDPAASLQKVKDFVTAYNSVVAEIKSFTSASGKSSDGTALAVQTRLRASVSQPVAGMNETLAALAQIGVSTQKDGTLSVTDATLTKAIKDNASGVAKLLGSDGASIGVARRVDNVLDQMLDVEKGSVITRQEGLAKRIKGMDAKVINEQARIDAYSTRVRKQFNSMEQALSKLQQASNSFLGRG